MNQEMISTGELGISFEGHSIVQLADELGTPFFLFSEAQLARNCAALKTGLSITGLDPALRYCVKTNNEWGILEVLARIGLGALVSHPAEGELAKAAGFAAEATAFQRPVLLPEDLHQILDLGINLVHVSHPSDVVLLEDLARARGCCLRISLRVANESPRLSLLGFMSRRLGLSPGDALAAARSVVSSSHLRLTGINFYVGTQQRSPAGFARAFRSAMALAARINAELRTPVEEVNLGGGIPSTSLYRATPLDLVFGRQPRGIPDVATARLEAFCRSLSELFVQAARRAGLATRPGLAAEPGRSVVGNAGVLITRVRAIKGNWAFLDASRNYLAESPLLLKRKVVCAARPMERTTRSYHLSGATLNTTDVMDFRRRLPPLEVGDALALADAGAYSLARASRYAGLAPAAYLVGRDGVIRIIRHAETVRELGGARIPV